MSSNLIQQPYPIILNPHGGGGSAKPAANAEFHVGEIDKDPVQYPRTDLAYKDESGDERLITSPLYTNNSGAFVVSKSDGTIIQPYMKDGVGYSVLIKGRRGTIYESKNVGDPGNITEIVSSTSGKTISDITGFYQEESKYVFLSSWHGFVSRNGVNQLSGGGGRFVYNQSRPKSDHNGGTVIDPDAQYSGDLSAYINAGGSGSGVYERVDIAITDPCMFGAKASDEVFDDLPAIQAMLNERGIRSFRDSVARLDEIGGKCRFIPYVTPYQMSDYATVFGDTQLDGNMARIRPTGANQLAMFYVNLRTDQQGPRGFNVNMEVVNFRLWSDRGFVDSGSTLDVSYLLYIDGGWIMMSRFGNFAFDVGCSLKSAIHFNLEHRNDSEGALVNEVGVPDGVELFNIKGTDAQNMSFCVSVVGDQRGSGSRLGKVNINNMLKGNQFAKDFNDPTRNTGVSGCIYLFEAEMNYNGDGGLDFIFGDIVCRRADENKFVGFRAASFGQLYNEIQTDKGWRQAQVRGGTYEDCKFNGPVRLYMDRTNAGTNEPQVFDAVFINTDLPKVSIRDGSRSGDQLRDNPITDLINIRNGSYNVNMRLPNIERTSETRAFQQRLITAPKWSNIYIDEVHRMRQITVNGQDITSTGDYVLHRVKANTVADLASNLNLQWSIRTQIGVTIDVDFYIKSGDTSSPSTSKEYLVGSVSLSNTAANENATFDLVVNAGERFNQNPSYNSRSGRWEAQSTTVTDDTSTALNIADMVLNVEKIDLQIVARVVKIGGTATIRATRVQDGYADSWVGWVL